jgi:hypothetical protein
LQWLVDTRTNYLAKTPSVCARRDSLVNKQSLSRVSYSDICTSSQPQLAPSYFLQSPISGHPLYLLCSPMYTSHFDIPSIQFILLLNTSHCIVFLGPSTVFVLLCFTPYPMFSHLSLLTLYLHIHYILPCPPASLPFSYPNMVEQVRSLVAKWC